jgi:high affinity Mn2+ porin
MKVFCTAALGLAVGAGIALTATGVSAGGFDRDRGSIKDGPYRAVHKWTGCYAGLHAGWGRANTEGFFTNAAGVGNFAYDYDADGGLAGVHAGCDYQINPGFVIGVVGDYDWTNIDGSQTNISDRTGTFATTYIHSTDIDRMASLRARAGVVGMGALWYVTGGWAWVRDEHSIAFTPAFGGGPPFLTYKDTRNGWTLGAGVEGYLFPHVTGFVEYRFTRVDGDTVNAPAVNTIDHLGDTDIHTIRVGFSIR